MVQPSSRDDWVNRAARSQAVNSAAIAFLSRLPLTWEALDQDKLTEAEQKAMTLLTAGGLVERRLSFRLGLVGKAETIEATVTATGEHGLPEASEPVVKAAWKAFAEEYRKGQEGAEEDQPTVFCERLAPDEVRLTQDGQQARQDVEAGETKRVLDFLHRRGTVFKGKVVPGHGKAEKLRIIKLAAPPARVELVNSGPMAEIAKAMQKLLEAQAKPAPTGTPGDLITTEIVLDEYQVSRATIRRKIQAGQIRDYRPPNSPKNTEYLLSRAEVDRVFARKK